MDVFVIPMAGLSSRFFKAGYTEPKYQLPLNEGTVFDWALQSFKNYFNEDIFLFIVRNVNDSMKFVEESCKALGIKKFYIHSLESETLGQAETVFLGLSALEKNLKGIYIFNIDSRREDFVKHSEMDKCDGYLELFEGEGTHWSFAKLDDKQNVLKTTEKERISDYCSDGLYYFKDLKIYNEAYLDAYDNNKLVKGELYIAPLYNYLIDNGYSIKGSIVSKKSIQFAGTPDEYENIIKGN